MKPSPEILDAAALDAGSAPDAEPLSFGRIYDLHYHQVWRWAAQLGGPAFDIEDALQEVFLRVHRHLSSFRGEAAISTWLYRITTNVVLQRLKERSRSQRQAQLPDAPAAPESPFESLQQRESRALAYAVLGEMSERNRTLFIAFELQGMAGEELARLFDVKLATLWVWLHRARRDFLCRLRRRGVAVGTDDAR